MALVIKFRFSYYWGFWTSKPHQAVVRGMAHSPTLTWVGEQPDAVTFPARDSWTKDHPHEGLGLDAVTETWAETPASGLRNKTPLQISGRLTSGMPVFTDHHQRTATYSCSRNSEGIQSGHEKPGPPPGCCLQTLSAQAAFPFPRLLLLYVHRVPAVAFWYTTREGRQGEEERNSALTVGATDRALGGNVCVDSDQVCPAAGQTAYL